MGYDFVNVNAFTPNTPGGVWQSVGTISGCTQAGSTVTLTAAPNADTGSVPPTPVIQFLSDATFRLRFNPSGIFPPDASYAVINPVIGPVNPIVTQSNGQITIKTNILRIVINMVPYCLSVYRLSDGQLLHTDTPAYNLVYIPGQEVIANFKVYPPTAKYFGFGEKAGSQLAKNEFTMTFFNFDNFIYQAGPLPVGNDPGPLNPSESLYCSVPFLLEVNPNPGSNAYMYGLFFDNAAQTYFNIGANDYSDMSGKYYFGALYGDLNYYFFYGDTVTDILTQYGTLTGFPPMPPKYALGYHQGGYGYYDSAILSGVAAGYRNNNIPIDGLHIDVDFQNNYRTFTSSDKKFPNPAALFATLHAQGFKMSTNITPLVNNNKQDETGNIVPYATLQSGLALNATTYPSGAFIPDATSTDSDGAFLGTVNYGQNPGSNPFQAFPPPTFGPPIEGAPLGSNGYYADFGLAVVRQWWGTQYTYLLGIGLDMIWQDMTCPALAGTPRSTFPLDLLMTNAAGQRVENARMHNGYVMGLLSATYSGITTIRPNTRNFIIARGGYAGMQRYAGLWTGDSASDWSFLQANLPIVLNLGLSGITISGCDIGGFANAPNSTAATLSGGIGSPVVGGITNYELLTRWMQLGSFLPWYRNHYDGYTKQFQEPYNYGDPVPANCSKYIQLRYRMLHVYYSAMYENTRTLTPIARPMFYNDLDRLDSNILDHVDDQFMVGDDFLVAPILNPFETADPPSKPLRNVYLPARSQWYAFMDNQAPLSPSVGGGAPVLNYFAPLDLVPIYVRAGAILPFCELEQWVGQLNSLGQENPITFNVYPGPDNSYQLYQDDGITENGPIRLTTVSQTTISSQPDTQRTVTIQRTVDNYKPFETFYYVAFLGELLPPLTVTAAGIALPNVNTSDALKVSPQNAYYYNASIQIVFAKIIDDNPLTTVSITSMVQLS
jgi:alpha-glucosidase